MSEVVPQQQPRADMHAVAISQPSAPTAPTRHVPPVYDAIVCELRKQILALGLTFEQCDELSGNQSGYTAKMLNPSSPSGRRATWDVLMNLVTTLYPCGGFVLTIKPRADLRKIQDVLERKLGVRGMKLSRPSWDAPSAKLAGKMGKIAIGDWAQFAGRKGDKARAQKLSEKRRKAIATAGGKARWRKPRLIEITPQT